MTDYQLCFWYALEIERRQAHYRSLHKRLGLDVLDYSLSEIADWNRFVELSKFVTGSDLYPDRSKFDQLLRRNQNPREGLLNGSPERELPEDALGQELRVKELLENMHPGQAS